MALPPLSEAGLHYGEAFCVPESEDGAPLDQLSRAGRKCVRRVGRHWEEDLVKKLDLPASDFYHGKSISLGAYHTLHARSGQEVGHISLEDNNVTMCLHGETGSRCEVIGHGVDALTAARNAARALGLQTR